MDMMEMNRRGMMAQIAALIGASSMPASALAAPKKAAAKRFLSPAQFQTFSAIADTVIPRTDTPGAVDVGVPALFDGLLLRWAKPSRKTALVEAISNIDKLAWGADKKGFAALAPARRKELLIAYDKEANKPGPPPKEKLNAFQAMVAGPPKANPGYLKLKDLVVTLYYASEVACTKEQVYEHVPGKWVPSLKITPESRPFAGTGGLF